mgnify:CR=1 FL=1
MKLTKKPGRTLFLPGTLLLLTGIGTVFGGRRPENIASGGDAAAGRIRVTVFEGYDVTVGSDHVRVRRHRPRGLGDGLVAADAESTIAPVMPEPRRAGSSASSFAQPQRRRFIPPPNADAEDESSESGLWLMPDAGASGPEPSGWGWLADSVQRAQREREQRERTTEPARGTLGERSGGFGLGPPDPFDIPEPFEFGIGPEAGFRSPGP